ncbi:unnamed protein product [Rhizophagus irregularis]|nr:unnamed protein product [Rhizophagus irregularis]
MSYIRRRTSNNTIFKNIGIRRRTNISHSCQNFVPASSRFNNNNSASNTSKTNRTRKPFTDRSNLEIQEERHVQNEENMTQNNDYGFFESEIQDIEEESIIQIEDNTIIQDVGGEENRIQDNNSNEDIGCIIETRNSHVKYNVMFFTGEFIQYRIESNTKIGRILAFVMDENNNTKIKVQQFLYNYELPRNFHSAARDSTKLWMTDRVIMISESRIITRISVWLKDNQEPSSYDYKVDEILYKFNNRYMMRPIKFRHHHPSEYIKLHPSPPGIQTLKIFIDLYFDDFGTFRTSYHSLGGLYVQFGNFPLKLRQQLKNHFLIGFVPFGGNFEDVIKPFINDLLILQKGLFMKIGNEEYWVSGGLGVVTADLPQGNDLAGGSSYPNTTGSFSYDGWIRFLDSTMVKSEVIQEIKSQNSLQRASQAVLLIKQCWINFALLAKLVFTSTLKSTDYIRIDQLTKTFSDVVLKRENTLQGIRFILDNGFDERYQNTQFSSMLHNHKLKFLCDTWYILSASMNDDISEDQVTIHSPLKNYINITVSGKWSLQEIRKAGFNGKDLDDNMKSDLYWAYSFYFKNDALIINTKVIFYRQVLFEILDDDSSLRSTVKLRVGDIVDVPGVSGDNDDDNEEWFAKIIAIIIHKDNNNNNCIFLMFDWFEYLNFDTNLQCHYYKLQERENWKRIHPITIISGQPKLHFIHNCNESCIIGKHDVNNRIFYRNDYLYTAV